MKHIFIINPYAGKQDSESLIPFIEQYFADKTEEYQIIRTEYAGHAKEIASGYTKEDDVCLYGIGGDGTMYEILNGLNEGVCMAIIPNGTGNDHFRNLKLDHQSLTDLLKKTIEGRVVKCDYGVANNRRYLNSSSMGIDADVNQLANEWGKKYPIPKSIVYIVAALKVVLKPEPVHFKITIGDKVLDRKSLLVAAMVGQYYGGGFHPSPIADLQDGLLDVIIVKEMKLSRILVVLPKYMKGTHMDLPEVEYLQTDALTLDADRPVLYGCDGEPILETHIEYHVEKGALNLRVPQECYLK